MPNGRTLTRTTEAAPAASDYATPIGLFDSGVGGLSVLTALARVLPYADLIYFADQKYCPYGARPADEIRARSRRITDFLSERACRVIVVACNTASAAALYSLRESYPQLVFVGMEPAVKPAAFATRSGKVAVLATRGTLDGGLFAHTRDAFARTLEVHTVYPSDWVELVERGEVDSPAAEASVRRVLEPLLAAGVDEIALGCTHYPFLLGMAERIAGRRAAFLDPSEAVARRTAALVPSKHPEIGSDTRTLEFYTTGNPEAFARTLLKLTGIAAPVSGIPD